MIDYLLQARILRQDLKTGLQEIITGSY